MKRNDSIRLTGHDPKRRSNFLSLRVCDLNEGHIMFAAFHGAAIVLCTRDLLRGIWTDYRDVIPSDFRQRFGKFLQTAVVCEAPVVDRRIGAEYDFKPTGCCLWRRTLLTGPCGIQ